MKNIITTALLPLLAGLAFSCSSSTALQSTESDDLYYASTDKTVVPEPSYGGFAGASKRPVNPDAGETANPEYTDAASEGTAVTNNYNYYDSDGSYARRYSGSRYRNYNYYSADPFYDPFYSPFGYSAAYCYNFYDPFWYPYCYPSGFSISIGYSWGYPGYYGYRPYGFYGYPYDYYGYGYGGYGSYYHGFYDGYYAGGGYGYGYHRNRVNYGPRTNRSNVPNRVPTGENTGRPASPGRVAQSDPNAGTVIPGRRPHRVAQPGTSAPGQAGQAQPATNQTPQNGRQETGRPAREAQVQPENYQFQPNTPQHINYSRPARDNATMPSQPDRAPGQDLTPAQQAPAQMEQSGRRQRNRSQSRPNYQPAEQRSAPVYENRRPARSVDNGGSFQSPGRGSSGSGMPSGGGGGGGGRPRR